VIFINGRFEYLEEEVFDDTNDVIIIRKSKGGNHHALRNMLTVMYNLHGIVINKGGPGWLNELGSWIT
jgi:hypothetical protein